MVPYDILRVLATNYTSLYYCSSRVLEHSIGKLSTYKLQNEMRNWVPNSVFHKKCYILLECISGRFVSLQSMQPILKNSIRVYILSNTKGKHVECNNFKEV